MTGLVLKLAPHERILVNGAVLENGERKTRISIVTPGVNVLRLRDAIHPSQANTPVTRACYIAQLIMSGDADQDEGTQQLAIAIEQLTKVFDDDDSRRILAEASMHLLQGNAYLAMRRLRELAPREARLLSSSKIEAYL